MSIGPMKHEFDQKTLPIRDHRCHVIREEQRPTRCQRDGSADALALVGTHYPKTVAEQDPCSERRCYGSTACSERHLLHRTVLLPHVSEGRLPRLGQRNFMHCGNWLRHSRRVQCERAVRPSTMASLGKRQQLAIAVANCFVRGRSRRLSRAAVSRARRARCYHAAPAVQYGGG
jgi:hypothetical protein